MQRADQRARARFRAAAATRPGTSPPPVDERFTAFRVYRGVLVARLQREVEAELVRVVELAQRRAVGRLDQVRLVAVVLVVDLQDGREPLEEVLAQLHLGGEDRHLAERLPAGVRRRAGSRCRLRCARRWSPTVVSVPPVLPISGPDDGLARRRRERRRPLDADRRAAR